MSWFSRAKPTADPMLPMLPVDDADWLRGCAVRVFAESGAPAPTAAGDHLVDARGQVYGLGNLAAVVALTPRAEREQVVREHARVVVAASSRESPQSLAEIHDIVVARVVGVDAPGDGPDLAPGLGLRACIDYPETVATVFDLAPLGGWAAVGPVAMANLSRLPLPDHEAVATRRGATVHLLSSEDMFGASRLLILDHLLGALRIPASPFGTLVAVPHRHLLAVHVLEGANVVPALDALVALARSGVDAAGPVSPEVYFRATDGGLQRVTSTAADGTVTVEVDGAFSQAMAAAGLVT